MVILRIVIVFCALVASGCVVPFPSWTEVAPALSGTVTDATSGQTLSSVTVTHKFDEEIHRKVYTNQNGRFTLGELQQFHWGYLFGVALNYPLPYWKVFPGMAVETDLYATCPGYRPYHRKMEFRQWTEQDGKPMPIPDLTQVEIQLVPKGGGS